MKGKIIMLDSIFNTATSADTNIAVGGLLTALASAFILGIFMSFVYLKTNKSKAPSRNFAITLVILPAVITVIILLVGSNIARAFSLAGAFSIIRFRSAPGDPKDITYVLFSMAVGLACGMGYIVYAVIVAVFLCLVIILLDVLGFGKVKSENKTLKIMVPENIDFNKAFESILAKYTVNYKKTRIKTAELGSVYEVFYSITPIENLNEKAFIDELRCKNGNLNISLFEEAPSNDFCF